MYSIVISLKNSFIKNGSMEDFQIWSRAVKMHKDSIDKFSFLYVFVISFMYFI